MMNRLLATLLISAAIGSVSAQSMAGAMMARNPVFDLVTMITALQEMVTTTEHPLDEQQAATLLEPFRELHEAPALAPGQAEAILQLVRDTLTPQQRDWIEAFTPDAVADRGDPAVAGITPAPEGRQMGIGPGGGGEPGRQRIINPAANPFAQPPMSNDLQDLLELLMRAMESHDGAP